LYLMSLGASFFMATITLFITPDPIQIQNC
jgi:hypothetical protein